MKEEAKVHVRHERPKAYFGQIEGKRSLKTLEGKQVRLPIRLSGQAPWHVKYHNLDGANNPQTLTINQPNEEFGVTRQGTYEILEVNDKVCPGVVDNSANRFHVEWIPRPGLGIAEKAFVEYAQGVYKKQDICEGDDDILELSLHGE